MKEEQQPMIIEGLTICQENYGPLAGQYQGSVSFKGHYGSVKIHLSPDLAEKVLAICGDCLVTASKDLASAMTGQILSASGIRQIEGE